MDSLTNKVTLVTRILLSYDFFFPRKEQFHYSGSVFLGFFAPFLRDVYVRLQKSTLGSLRAVWNLESGQFLMDVLGITSAWLNALKSKLTGLVLMSKNKLMSLEYG